jgi:hypothetical protein
LTGEINALEYQVSAASSERCPALSKTILSVKQEDSVYGEFDVCHFFEFCFAQLEAAK